MLLVRCRTDVHVTFTILGFWRVSAEVSSQARMPYGFRRSTFSYHVAASSVKLEDDFVSTVGAKIVKGAFKVCKH